MSRWTAPGRVNLIGEHLDYNEGLVLPLALPLSATAVVTRRSQPRVRVVSDAYREAVDFDLAVQPGELEGWAAYVAGAVWALMARTGTDADSSGLDIQLSSSIPVGSGLASSAAVTCAVAAAANDELHLGLDPRELAAICRQAENDFVGVPTGSMDQLASMLCRPGHALLIDCRSSTQVHVPLDLPAGGLRLLVIDTGVRHALMTSGYADRRAECGAAATAVGLDSLRDATPADVRRITDPVLRRRAQHVVTEIERVRDVVAMLSAGHPANIGSFLTASHDSLRDDFEVSCDELDVTVDAALRAGALGARMTGGGFGGCAIAMCRHQDVDTVIDRVEAAYSRRGWQSPSWWAAQPSAGARKQE